MAAASPPGARGCPVNSNDTYRIWLKDSDGGFDLFGEVGGSEAAAVLATFQTFPIGRNIIII